MAKMYEHGLGRLDGQVDESRMHRGGQHVGVRCVVDGASHARRQGERVVQPRRAQRHHVACGGKRGLGRRRRVGKKSERYRDIWIVARHNVRIR